MKIQLTIETSQDDDGEWVAECDHIVGCGTTKSEAVERLLFALAALTSYGVGNLTALTTVAEVQS